jgi:Bacterial Ig-like domain (group 2)
MMRTAAASSLGASSPRFSILATILCVACSAASPTLVSDSASAVRVAVTPAAITINVGRTTQFSAALYQANGSQLTGKTVVWRSNDTLVARVSNTGVVSGTAPGSTTVTATSGSLVGTASVQVTQVAPPPVARVVVSPASPTVTAGATLQLSAAVYDASNNQLSGQTISWSSSDTGIARTSATGLVTGIAAGNAVVTATSGGVKGTASLTVTSASPPPPPTGCTNPQPGWLWCDDFEQDRTSSYFEYVPENGSFVRTAGVGRNASSGMRARWTAGQVTAGSLKLAFGRTPDPYFRAVDAGTTNYRELFWRVYVRTQAGWKPNGNDKFTRAIVFAKSDWSEAAMGHVWAGSSATSQNYLVLDPASGTDPAGNLVTVGYNDFDHLTWLGAVQGQTPVFGTGAGQWYCVEAHMRLNDAGQSNGLLELWINGVVDAQHTGLNWLGSYSAYGINALFLENYINNGAPQAQVRDYDELVVSTKRIGC